MTDSDRDVFQTALSDFTFEAACGGAIRHLADSGCTAKQIMERLDYPISGERVRKALYKHLCDTNVILEVSPEEEIPGGKPEYIMEYNYYGKPSYRKKNTESVEEDRTVSDPSGTTWKESVYRPLTNMRKQMSGDASERAFKSSGQGMWKKVFGSPDREDAGKMAGCPGEGAELWAFLTKKCGQKKDVDTYISCDFGIPDSIAAKGILLLNGRQQEYLEGILWPRHRVYHKLDHRMKEILCSLYERHSYEGVCYFMSNREKMNI